MKPVTITLCITFIVLINTQRTYACDCPSKSRMAYDELVSSGAVVTGVVMSTREIKMGKNLIPIETEIKVKVSKSLKGPRKSGTVFTLFTHYNCGYNFEKGKSYLIYAYHIKKRLYTSFCTRTKPLAEAAQDFEEIEAGTKLKSKTFSSIK